MSAPVGEQPPPYVPGYPQQPGQPPQGYGAQKVDPGYPPGPQPGYPGYAGYPPPGGPQYGQPGGPQYGQPGGPQYGQPGYPPASVPQQQGTTVVVGMPTVTVVHGLSEAPMNTTCPQCRQSIVTRTSYETGTLTWLICGAILLFGCWLGCCLIPFCVDGCKDVRHTCPNCNTSVGIYRRI